MLVSKERLGEIIVRALQGRELQLLQLTVAVHKQLDRHEGIKGSLSDRVKAALRPLVASNRIIEQEGAYRLP